MSSPRGVVTNGIDEPTTAHLNLTVTMADQVYAERSRERKVRRQQLHKRRRKTSIQQAFAAVRT